MKYLFLDLEFANSFNGSIKICEFGYLITNENFKVIEKDNIIINPNISIKAWDHKVVSTILTRKISEYLNRAPFPTYYQRIKRIFSKVDFIFGHTTAQDVLAINDECIRYKLPSLDFVFYDIKTFYKNYAKETNDKSVVKILEALNITGINKEHDVLADAYNTMLILKTLLNIQNINLEEIIKLNPTAKDSTKNYNIASYEKVIKRQERKFLNTITNLANCNVLGLKTWCYSKKIFNLFLDNLKLSKRDNTLKDLIIFISPTYTSEHLRQTLNLVQLIIDYGGKFTTNLKEANTIVKYKQSHIDGSIKNDILIEK